MKSETYPLALPTDLYGELRKAAEKTGLSVADAMRQSMKLGLPKLVEQLSRDQVKPMTAEEARRAFGPNPEFDALESAMCRRPMGEPEDD